MEQIIPQSHKIRLIFTFLIQLNCCNNSDHYALITYNTVNKVNKLVTGFCMVISHLKTVS
jgi:hypothetical protein